MAKIGSKRSARRRRAGRNKSSGSGGSETTRVSLRTIAFLFPPESLQRVYLHGRWQRQRGRQPCLRLSNQQDPRLAYEQAAELEGEYLRRVLSQPNAYSA